MTFAARITIAAALGAAMVSGAALSASPALVGYIVMFTQAGPNIIANGSGSFDLTDLSFAFSNATRGAVLWPTIGYIETGLAAGGTQDEYTGFTGPANFGSGSLIDANSGSGDPVSIIDSDNHLLVPVGYVFGTALSDAATWDGATFTSLSVTPGTYKWT